MTTTTTTTAAKTTAAERAVSTARGKVAAQLAKIDGYEFNANKSRLVIVSIIGGIAPQFATKAGKIQPTPAVRAVMPDGTSNGVVSQFVKAFNAVEAVATDPANADKSAEELDALKLDAVAAVWSGESTRVKATGKGKATGKATGKAVKDAGADSEDDAPEDAPEVDLFADTLAAAKKLAACLKTLDSVTVEQEQELQAALTLVTKNLKTVKRV